MRFLLSGLAVSVIGAASAWAISPADTSGGLSVAINPCASTSGTAPSADCGTSRTHTVVGGGGRVSNGGLLRTIAPIRSSDEMLWRAGSEGPTNHTVTSWAIGLQIPGINTRTLRRMMTLTTATNPSTATPSVIARPGANRYLFGGGASGTRRLFSSEPTIDGADHNGWFAAASPAPATVTASQIWMRRGILEGAGLLEVQVKIGATVTVASGEAVATGAITSGWAPIAWGARTTTTSQSPRHLTKVGMVGNGISSRTVEVRSKSAFGGGTITPTWVEARIRPNSHGLCNVGGPLSTGNQDDCARLICQSDPFCCNNTWDGQCVAQVESVCGRSCEDYTCSRPRYTPSFWNDGGTIQNDNNCYNYATNRRTDSHAAPGRAAFGFTPCPDFPDPACFSVEAFTEFLLADGITRPRANGTCAEGRQKIALAIAPEFDFHFYRQDADGTWSHKPGNTAPATNLDDSGRAITDPATADRGIYTEFGGYFCTCSDFREGEGHATIN